MFYTSRALCLVLVTLLSITARSQQPAILPNDLPEPTASQLPGWYGFNLTEKFHRDWSNGPFLENDFRMIHELGFNFVRLPMDYRVWIQDDDWNRLDEATLTEIDQAIRWGEQYSIHVCINFHRAPGYTVADPPEAKSLWTDQDAQAVCAEHWAMFARRYRDIPNKQLSFNLFNEPAHVEAEVYVGVVKQIVSAIRAEDPDRLIISDGLQWGQKPVVELAELGIAQATRGYVPSGISHYKAGWVTGADEFPPPTWPRLKVNGTLYQKNKPDLAATSKLPLIVRGPFERKTQLRLRVQTVSHRATLVAKADGEVVWQKSFICGPGEGEWKTVVYQERWNTYQNVYDRDYQATIPAGTNRVELSVADGDWLRISEIGLTPSGQREDILVLQQDWDSQPADVTYCPAHLSSPFEAATKEDRRWLWDTMIAPWQEAQAQGIGVMVGEFGCYNKTPHDVALHWLEDCLANWHQAGWGWALWNFRGSFGILDSGRKDVTYEDYQGHKLDRKMLDLLLQYRHLP
jgi:aryl-phospho-beta-D-glucosidase BglC (GH1 family)